MEDARSFTRKRSREQDDAGDSFDPVEAAEVKRLRDDLLGILDDADLDPGTQDLDSLVRSFQEEISSSSSTSTAAVASEEEPAVVEVVDLTSESGELVYLLGASDDDLGLPPSIRYDVIDDAWDREAELAGVPYDYAVGGEFWGFEGHVDGFGEGLGFGSGTSYDSYDGDEGYEYVAYDGGLFDYSEVWFDTSDLSGLSSSRRRGYVDPMRKTKKVG